MTTTIKLIKKPTPIRNAVMVCSLTCNLFLGLTAYAVYHGQLARTDITITQPVELTANTQELPNNELNVLLSQRIAGNQ